MKQPNVILSRVSSEEQKKGFSPEAQITMGRRHAELKDYNVVAEFVFDESASYSKPNSKREKFWEAINFIKDYYKKHKKRVVLSVEVVDRLQRGFKEYDVLETLIYEKVLQIDFIEDKFYVNAENLDDVADIWEEKILDAKKYIRKLKKNVKRGMRGARENKVVFKLPIGYQRKHGEVTTTDCLPFVVEAFNRVIAGQTISQIATQYNHRGVVKQKLSKNYNPKWTPMDLHRIITNPFYMGIAKSEYGNYPHEYPVAVTKDTFLRANRILNSRRSKNNTTNVKPFIFRGVFKCSECGYTINPDQKKGAYNSGIYNYYRCWVKTCKNNNILVKEEKLLKEFEHILTGLVFPPEMVEMIIKDLRNETQIENLYNQKLMNDIAKEIKEKNIMLDNLLDMRLSGEIEKDLYTTKKEKLETEILELQEKSARLQNSKISLHTQVENLFEFIKKLPEIWKLADMEEKNMLVKLLTSNSTQSGDSFDINLIKPLSEIVFRNAFNSWFTVREILRTFDWGSLPDLNEQISFAI